MRQLTQYFDKILIAVTVATAATALWIAYSTIEDVRSARKELRESLPGLSAQADYELLTLLDSLDRFQNGDEEVGSGEVIDRFDVLWSRIQTNSSGQVAEHYLSLPGAKEALSKATKVLQDIEPRILSLRRDDVTTIGDIKRQLRTLLSELHAVTLAANARNSEDAAALYAERMRTSRLFILFLSIVLVAGTGVVALLWHQRRQLDSLSTDLESRVEQRTRELERSEARFRDVAEAASDWFWELDADLRFSYISDRYETVAGVGPERLLGKRPDEVYPRSVARQSDVWQAYFDAVRDHKDFRELVHDDFRQDGQRRVIRSTGKAIFDEDGTFAGYRGTSTDITASKVTEEALQEREMMLKAVIDNVPLSLSLKDLEGRFTLVNPGFERLHGVTEEEVFGRTFFDILPHEIAADAAAEDRMVLEGGEPLQTDYSWPKHLGNQHEIILKFPLRLRDKGPIMGLGVISLDVTEHKRAEQMLKDSRDQLRLITDNLPVNISYLNQDLRFEFVNKTAERRFASPAEKIIGSLVEDVMNEDSWRKIRPYVARGLKGETVIYEETLDYPDGKTRDVEVIYVPHFAESGEVLGICVLSSDVTEQKRAAERLRQAQKMEAIGQLTGGIAHDFNNLLAIIMGHAELLLGRLGRDDEAVNAIHRSAGRGAELTQRLLAYSRQQPLRPQAIDLADLVSGMSELLNRVLGEVIEIEIAAEPDLWSTMADPGQVENALLNLALNARDAMPDGGRLAIKCFNAQVDEAFMADNPEMKADRYVVLAVSDKGSGMTAEVQAHAFEPFFTTKDVGQGSGLGLSMVYGFAKQSGGQVTIESAEGQGTTMNLYLPAVTAEVRSDPTERDENLPLGDGEVVLIIEDNSDVRHLTARLLQDLNYRVIDVADAAAAHATLGGDRQIDLVLSDIVLPGGTSGPEFAEQARTLNPDLRIIFMSGYPAEAAKHKSFLDSDQVLLNKPFQRRQLAEALHQALVSSRMM